jgi:DNA topoisomerase-2
MSTIEEEFKYIASLGEQAKSKDWLVGSKVPTTTSEFIIIGDKSAGMRSMCVAPALLKLFGEAIENATDHWERCRDDLTKIDVTRIEAVFYDDGTFSIENDGSGIPTGMHKVAGIPLIQLIFGTMGQGSNNRDVSASTRIGTNGLGIKAVNIYSKSFQVESNDGVSVYSQTWRGGLDNPDKPQIIKAKKAAKQYVRLTFDPDYTFFSCFKPAEELSNWVYTRMVFTSIYLNYTAKLVGAKPPRVTFNGENVAITTMAQLARIMGELYKIAPISTFVRSTNDENPTWELSILVLDNPIKVNAITCMNGAVISAGSHIKRIEKLILDGIGPKFAAFVSKKGINIKPRFIMENIIIFMSCQVKGANWGGQRKDSLINNVTQFAGYCLDEKFTNAIFEQVRDTVILKMFDKEAKEEKKAKVVLDMSKYREAKNIRSNPLACRLFLPEGDSASAPIQSGILSCSSLNIDNCGIMTLGGVIINVRKEITTLNIRGREIMQKSEKLTENDFFNTFLAVTGLNLAYQYDPTSPTYRAEMATLRYGGIIGCLDQDLDGFNIFGLILNMFSTLWPNLVQSGYVCKLNTPIIRAYPKGGGKVVGFYYLTEFEKWSDLVGPDTIAKYKIVYFKGLAQHSSDEYKDIFEKYNEQLYAYCLTDDTYGGKPIDWFEVYYGKDTAARKTALKRLPLVLTEKKINRQRTTMVVNCRDELRSNVHEYQRDNIERKLNGVDGLNQARRICLNACFNIFRGTDLKEVIKVEHLAGNVANKGHYKHGATSLEDTIKRMAFTAVGGMQIPPFVKVGDFGSRVCGGKNAGQARYVLVGFNHRAMSLLYPAADYYNLEFVISEGTRCEPTYFVPIMPPVLEHAKLPATGWKVELWARDFASVLRSVRSLIGGGKSREPRLWSEGYYGKTEILPDGRTVLLGEWDYANETITVSELPLRTWSGDYYLTLCKFAAERPELVRGVHSYNTAEEVCIKIELFPGAYDIICLEGAESPKAAYGLDPVTTLLGLYSIISNSINFLDIGGSVLEFDTYRQVIDYWYGIRKEFYAIRIKKEKLLLGLRIMHLSEYLRYIALNVVIRDRSEEEVISELISLKFRGITPSIATKPGWRTCEEIEEAFWSNSFNYLLNTSDRDRFDKAINAKRAELEKLKAELAAYDCVEDFPGQTVWLRELDALEAVYIEGIATDWKFDEYKIYEYN